MSVHASALSAKTLSLAARVLLGLLVGLLASLPASAADHAGPNTATVSASNDLFAAYDAALNDAASEALRNVTQSRQLPTAGPAPGRPDSKARSMSAAAESPGRKAGDGWQRVERFLPIVDPILRQVGIPVQLAAVVLVESGGNPAALSPKGARGLWQLMPNTARQYGLVVNAETDQRLDIQKSTRAAAEYLRDLYTEFHNWPLALAAYNAGDQAVQKALTQTGSGTFSVAASALPVETQNYVPAVLSALPLFGRGALSDPSTNTDFEQAVYAVPEK